MTWVMYWTLVAAVAVGCLIDHNDRKTAQAREDLDRLARIRALDEHNAALFDPFAELDLLWCQDNGIDLHGTATSSLPMSITRQVLPSRPAKHSPHRTRRGF